MAAEAGGLLPTKTIATAVSACPHLGSRTAPHRRRLQTAELRPHRQPPCHLESSRLRLRTSAAHSLGSAPSIALCGCAWDEGWGDGWLSQLSYEAGRRATLVSHLHPAHEPPPESFKKSPCRSHGKALGSDQHSRRPTDKLQILSWNSGPVRGSDQRALADHLNGPWHIICIQEVPSRRTSTSPTSTIAPCSSTRTPVRGTSRVYRCRFRARTLTPHGRSKVWLSLVSFAWFPTRARISRSPNVQINNECAKRRSVCLALLLLIRDFCSKLSAVVLTDDFNKAVERELPAGDPNGQRRLSAIGAAFNHASIYMGLVAGSQSRVFGLLLWSAPFGACSKRPAVFSKLFFTFALDSTCTDPS